MTLGGGFTEEGRERRNNDITSDCLGFLVIALVIFCVGYVYWEVTRPNVPVFYSPGDTHLVAFSSFCAGITLKKMSNTTTTSIYLITETPTLTDRKNFTIRFTINLASDEYIYWNYYIHPNSKLSTSVCLPSPLHSSGDGTFYVIRGGRNFVHSKSIRR